MDQPLLKKRVERVSDKADALNLYQFLERLNYYYLKPSLVYSFLRWDERMRWVMDIKDRWYLNQRDLKVYLPKIRLVVFLKGNYLRLDLMGIVIKVNFTIHDFDCVLSKLKVVMSNKCWERLVFAQRVGSRDFKVDQKDSKFSAQTSNFQQAISLDFQWNHFVVSLHWITLHVLSIIFLLLK